MYNSMKLYRESRRYREMKFKIGIIVFSFPFFFIEIRNAEGGGVQSWRNQAFARMKEKNERTFARVFVAYV